MSPWYPSTKDLTDACSSCGSFCAEHDDPDNLCPGCRHAVDAHGQLVSSAYAYVCDCPGYEPA